MGFRFVGLILFVLPCAAQLTAQTTEPPFTLVSDVQYCTGGRAQMIRPDSTRFAAAFLLAALVLLQLGSVWRTTWSSLSVERAGIFCYRSFARSWASSEN